MPGEPRYAPVPARAVSDGMWRCLDCGSMGVAEDQAAHTRFHSILSAHAWALAILKNRAPVEVQERINSKQFDSWSADALAEVIASHGGAVGEACAQLAESEAAKLRAGDSPEWMAPGAGALEDFADLLRQQRDST